MMKERSVKAAVVAHVDRFVTQMELIPNSGKVLIAVSGGLDSMVLLHLAVELRKRGRIKQIDVIHINHGTRAENAQEEHLVRRSCQMYGVGCRVEKLQLNSNLADFERLARQERYRLFENCLERDATLFTAHHIDDSYEWHLLQKFRSGKESLGIPLKNGSISRPLMALTRAQVERYGRLAGIHFFADPSNTNERFDRNFIRKMIIPSIAERFPRYLKHYTAWATQRAAQKGLLVGGSPISSVVVEYHVGGGVLLISSCEDFSGTHELIEREICKLSGEARGVLGSQISKLIEMSHAGFKGPLTLSGGVLAYSAAGVIYLLHQDNLCYFEWLDNFLATFLRTEETAQIPRGGVDFESARLESSFPLIAFFHSQRIPSLKRDHPLFPRSCQVARELGMGFDTLRRFCRHSAKLKTWKSDESYLLVTHSMLQG